MWRGFSVQPLKINTRLTEPPIIKNYSLHHDWCGTVNICLRAETSNYNPLVRKMALWKATKSRKVRRLKLLTECWQERYFFLTVAEAHKKTWLTGHYFNLSGPLLNRKQTAWNDWEKKKVTATMSLWGGHHCYSFQHNGGGFVLELANLRKGC